MESFERIEAKAKKCAVQFEREIKCKIYSLDNEKTLVVTEMQDDFHKIKMAFTTDSGYRILDISASMEKVPFGSCRGALPSLERLAGTGVYEGGVLKKIHQLIPKNEGCTHLYEMLESSFGALFASMQKKSGAAAVEESRDIVKKIPSLAGTCISFKHF